MSTWWIVFAGALAHAVSTGLAYFGLSAYFPSFEREFGWSRTAISGAFSMARVESGLLGPAEGYMTDRLGPKRVMYLGIVICAVGFIGMSLVNSLPMLYVAIVAGIVLGSSVGFYIPISVVVATLFRARRSLAFGIFRMGPGLSGALVPVVGFMIVWWGWRAAAVASAFIIVAMGWPLARAIGSAYERDAGLPDTPAAGPGAPVPAPDVSLTLKQALRTRSFWLLSAVMGLRQMVTEGISVHLVILLVDRGWGPGSGQRAAWNLRFHRRAGASGLRLDGRLHRQAPAHDRPARRPQRLGSDHGHHCLVNRVHGGAGGVLPLLRRPCLTPGTHPRGLFRHPATSPVSRGSAACSSPPAASWAPSARVFSTT